MHEPSELFGRKGPYLIGIAGPGEVAAFDAFVQEQKTVAFPEETFDLRSGYTAEKEECIRDEKTEIVSVLDDGGQRINTESEVGASAYEINAGKGIRVSISKHSAPP